MKARLFFVLLVGIFILAGAQAQSYQEFVWAEGDLVLIYPSDWDMPFVTEQDSIPILQLAQALADMPTTRPPGIPFIEIKRIPSELVPLDDTFSPDIPSILRPTLEANGLIAGPLIPVQLGGYPALGARAASDDSTLIGRARAAVLDDGSVLLIWGRWPQGTGEAHFEAVANSIVLGQSSDPIAPTYGVLWYTQSLPTDGETAFLDVVGLDISGDTLALLDAVADVMRFSAQTGLLLDRIPLADSAQASAIAIGPDGVLYVADRVCSCILAWRDSAWVPILTDFNADYPIRMAVSGTNRLVATDYQNGNMVVRALDASIIIFESPLSAPPLLAFDRQDRLFALADGGTLYAEDGVGFSPLIQLPPLLATDFVVDAVGRYIVATENEGIIIYDADGTELERVGRVVANFPLPGEVVSPRGLAMHADGTLYWADSDSQFGSLTAASRSVQSGRIGETSLVPNRIVMGTLDAFVAQQTWTFEGAERQIVDIAAQDVDAALALTLRVLGPDGAEIAFSAYSDDEASASLRLNRIVLPREGTYYIVVGSEAGAGNYQLALTTSQTLDLSDGTAEMVGEISPLFPAQQWTIDGRAGQVITVTMIAEGGTGLDPLLRIRNPQGDVLAENDDADDPALGRDAQIVGFRLPTSGVYTIEAAQFDGYGPYRLIVVVTT